MRQSEIPYKIYLYEDEMPRYWYNVRADMKKKPAPLLNPETLKPCTAEELGIIPAREVLYRKETGYGAEAIVRRSAVPRGAAVSPVSIEELFIVMAKEAG